MNGLKKLLVKARRQVFSQMGGNNVTRRLGEGYDFAELREYRIGDDVRKIDWLISAKLGAPHVKLFHEERELNLQVVALLPGSTVFGNKREKIAEVAALLGYSAVKNGDRFGGRIFADRVYHEVPPGKKSAGVEKLAEAAAGFDPVGKGCDYPALARLLHEKIRSRSVVFALGDFYGPVTFGPAAKKHEIIAVIVRDRREEAPETMKNRALADPVTGRRIGGNLGQKSMIKYKEMLLENDRKLADGFRREGVRFLKIYTDEPALPKLLRFFGRG